MTRSTLFLAVGFSAFLGLITYLVAASLVRREQPTFEPTPIAPRPLKQTYVVDTITVDARNPRQWRFLDFDRRSVVSPPDTAAWDLAIRRFHIMAAGEIADLGPVRFDSVMTAPAEGYVANRLRADTLNPAIARWYRYSALTHLLEPKANTYVVRSREGTYAKLEILSYYCSGLVAGCLTLRYGYRRDGTRRLEPD